ncbi:hypothetical protein C8024_12590 [Sphingopyxis sp. BSNA05]|uniref:hypothetical protein n=1 Tax=Sphingopyxis sp. BSNA05 TaxID=1236614 RepID=UPI001566A938|nr:hypothetical protein [Sphingopyxis sp. BSNA05]NRD90116.1 hypothetical protein [Sphingopyxis sp. BSNA05]
MIDRVRRSRLSRLLIAVIALPMAAMPLAANPDVMTIQLCSADGAVRDISIPVERDDSRKDCAKPCHACLSRKKAPKS